MTQAANFVHLHVHSEFSLSEGLLKVKDVVNTTAERGTPALALTDCNNLFALVKFYETCLSQGVKPILGAEIVVSCSETGMSGRIVALARNVAGYSNLIALISAGYTSAEQRGIISEEDIFARKEGLIILAGGVGGHLWGELAIDDQGPVLNRACRWQQEFTEDYFLEITRTGREKEEEMLRRTLVIASKLEIGVVASNDVCFTAAEDFEAHETRVCIHQGRALDDTRRKRQHSQQQYLRSDAEMATLFADIPSALQNTVEIAKRCNVEVPLGTYYLPDYPIPNGLGPEDYIQQVSQEGLDRRLTKTGPLNGFTVQDYSDRLAFELGVINQMGFAGYFLIVMEFIAWAKSNGIPVGPGRGSGAGSLVAYVLDITDLDPLEYDLLFERFLNPERVSMPDFDVDFCMEGRDKVIQHVTDMYGVESVSQIITFGTMAAKAVVRDVARVQGKPYGLADKLSKLIPFEVGMTLTKAMAESAEMKEFVESSEEASEIMDMAFKLEGIVRNVGRHAGGVVIAPSALTDFVPLYTEESGTGLVSQFDKDDVERAGLVKFDFLGLKTLTIIDWAVKSVNKYRQTLGKEPVEIENIPLDDRGTFEQLRRGETTGIFQLESRGMKELIRRLLPENIDDIIALVALFRPGPLESGAVEDYINRKHGTEAVSFPHPSLEPVLESTFGVVLYQEQVMQIAQVLAGFSLGQADLLRRAMGKKKASEMAKVRKQFLVGTAENDVSAGLANEIFDLMEKFAGYAFNKSHSATYAIVSFQTAWLKSRYPAHFMAANLSADMQSIDRVVILVDEVRRMKMSLLPPGVNISEFRFSVKGDAVIYGLGAVRGVGEGPVSAIVEARAQGPYLDLADFCRRVDNKKANKRVLLALISSGAMDEFALADETLNQTRARLLATLPLAVQGAEQVARDQAVGITDLFGGIESQAAAQDCEVKIIAKPLTTLERLSGEKDTLGLYLTGHPIESYEKELGHFCRSKIKELRASKNPQWVAGMVISNRVMKNKRGSSMAFLVLDDRSARLEVSLFSDAFQNYVHKVAKDELLVIEGEIQSDERNGGISLRASQVLTMDEARQKFSRGLALDFTASQLPDNFNQKLKEILQPYQVPGATCPIAILYKAQEAQGKISLGPEWHVKVSQQLLFDLEENFGDEKVSLNYPQGRNFG